MSPSPSITHRDHPRSLHAAHAQRSLIDGGDELREGRAGEGGRAERGEIQPCQQRCSSSRSLVHASWT